MQDFDVTTENEEVSQQGERVQQIREYVRLIFKRVLVYVCFGPGVLGVLWLIGRALKR